MHLPGYTKGFTGRFFCWGPEPWDMPGYDSPVIMAAGAFVQGSSIELSADAPIRPPYTAYMQGGLVYEHVKLGVMCAVQGAEKQKNNQPIILPMPEVTYDK